MLTGQKACPGVKDSRIWKGIKTYGLYVANCDGSASQPVTLSGLHFDISNDAQTPLYFDFINANSQEPKAFVVQSLTLPAWGSKSIPGQVFAARVAQRQVQFPADVKVELATSSDANRPISPSISALQAAAEVSHSADLDSPFAY